MFRWVGALQERLDSWARQQRRRILIPPVGMPLEWNWKWPWYDAREQKKKLQEEYNRKKEQIQSLCSAIKAEDVKDLQDILSAMILSECVYKRPESEVIRALNNFKADFGDQLVHLQQVQPSLDHVQHRYLLAEGGDVLFASFIGTKQYKDIIADANILQGALFHEDFEEDDSHSESEARSSSLHRQNSEKIQVGLRLEPPSANNKGRAKRRRLKPAAHRGFLARAKGIPAVELYKLAQRKERRLVLCGHSLGGAVAVLATLAILRAFASSSGPKNGQQVKIKCITFSQPPVGNAALSEYVHRKGWHKHFQTYCIPEDIIPRILSPAYFQHYRTQAATTTFDSSFRNGNEQAPSVDLSGGTVQVRSGSNTKSNVSERLVLGVGPLQNSLWRISKLVPLVTVQKPLSWLKNRQTGMGLPPVEAKPNASANAEAEGLSNSLEIQEDAESVMLTPFSPNKESDKPDSELDKNSSAERKRRGLDWRSRVPSLPSYVPFGQLFLLEKSSVEPLSASDYTKLTSVQSVLVELKDRFQSHTMRSYRARFQKLYDNCMCDGGPALFNMEHIPQLPHLHQWLGFQGTDAVEIGKIADPLVIRTATSIVPLGWTGSPGEKNGCDSLRVDIQGYGLHLCTLVKAQVNGRWYSTTVESLPLQPPLYGGEDVSSLHLKLQKMRVRIGAPLQRPPPQQLNLGLVASSATAGIGIIDCGNQMENTQSCQAEGLSEVTVYCSSDFMTASKRVAFRLRRIRLLGLEGAGKTSLFYAIMGQGRGITFRNTDGVLPNTEWQEGVAEGLAYIDPAGVNLQDLVGEAGQLRQELAMSKVHLKKKVDLVILVHNLAHKIPRLHEPSGSTHFRPALSLLLDEVTSSGTPRILAITNKFAVSADRRDAASAVVMGTYKVPPNLTALANSSPYAVHGTIRGRPNLSEVERPNGNNTTTIATTDNGQRGVPPPLSPPSRFRLSPMLSFRKKELILPVEGLQRLRTLVHQVLLTNEEAAFEELAREQLVLETQSQISGVKKERAKHDHFSETAVAGAGFSVIIAILAMAATSLRKPPH